MVSHCELNGVCVIICKARLGAFLGVKDGSRSLGWGCPNGRRWRLCSTLFLLWRKCLFSLEGRRLAAGVPSWLRDSGGRDEGQLLQVRDKTDPCLWMRCPRSCGQLALTSAQCAASHLRCPGRCCGLLLSVFAAESLCALCQWLSRSLWRAPGNNNGFLGRKTVWVSIDPPALTWKAFCSNSRAWEKGEKYSVTQPFGSIWTT